MAFGIKFISGKYQGGEFPLAEGAELLIGRANDLDLVLAEDMVSRKHAKMALTGSSLSVTDLGSTNGTFVNGEKVKRADLKVNDRVLIGTSILKIIDQKELTQNVGADREAIRVAMQKLSERTSDSATMSGDLEEVPLPDLLQLFTTNKKAGILSISGVNRGKIYMKQGQIEYAVIAGDLPMKPMKALCRMITWTSGTFQLEPYDESIELPERLTESTESILIEALRQFDEVKRLMPDLPPLEAHLALCVPMTPKLSALKPSELDTLQLAINFGTAKSVMDKTPSSDHEALTNLHKLIAQGYLEAAD
jgi:hypothetical protein